MRYLLINTNRCGLTAIFFGLSLCVGLTLLVAPMAQAYPPDAPAKRSPLLAALQAEMERSMKTLRAQAPRSCYLASWITGSQGVNVPGWHGALLVAMEAPDRLVGGWGR